VIILLTGVIFSEKGSARENNLCSQKNTKIFKIIKRRGRDTGYGIRDTGYGIRDTGYGIWDTGWESFNKEKTRVVIPFK